MPSLQQRKEILTSLTEELPCEIDFDSISRITPGFVAHDLFLLIQEAINIKKKRNLKVYMFCFIAKFLLNLYDTELASCVV